MSRKPRPQTQKDDPKDLYADWIEHLGNASKDRLVIVEHGADKKVLEKLGIKNVLFYTEPEQDFIAKLVEKGKECILLFDADRKSNQLCSKVKALLQERGVKCNTRFRKVLFTGQFKEVASLLKFLHEHVWDSPRKHQKLDY